MNFQFNAKVQCSRCYEWSAEDAVFRGSTDRQTIETIPGDVEPFSNVSLPEGWDTTYCYRRDGVFCVFCPTCHAAHAPKPETPKTRRAPSPQGGTEATKEGVRSLPCRTPKSRDSASPSESGLRSSP